MVDAVTHTPAPKDPSRVKTKRKQNQKKIKQESWVRSLVWEDPLERQWQPTPLFLPGESHRQRRVWWATIHGVAKSQTQLSDFHSLTQITRKNGENTSKQIQ